MQFYFVNKTFMSPCWRFTTFASQTLIFLMMKGLLTVWSSGYSLQTTLLAKNFKLVFIWNIFNQRTFRIFTTTRSLHVQASTFPNMFKASASSNFLFPCLATCNACSKRLNACASASDFMWTLPIESKHLYSVSLRLWSLAKQQAKNLSFKKAHAKKSQ